MFKQIKRVAAMLLVICLFLPLSQCTQPPRPNDPSAKEIIYTRYAIDICPFVQLSHCPAALPTEITKEHWLNLLFGVPFILPFFMVLLRYRAKQEKLRYEVMGVLMGIMVGGIIYLHTITGGKLLIGAYFAIASAASYVLASVAEMVKIIRERAAKKR